MKSQNTKGRHHDIKKLVGRIGDEYYFVDYVFSRKMHGSQYKGATGTILVPVSRAEYEQYMTEDSVNEYLEDNDLTDLIDEIPEDEWASLFWDDSYSGDGYWDILWGFLPESEYPRFNCVGGGRIFHHNIQFDEVYDKKLLNRIRKYETT